MDEPDRRLFIAPPWGLVTLWLCCSPAWAVDIRLLPAENGPRSPLDPLVLQLSTDLPGQWAVELDGIDVTALLERQGTRWVIQPLEPLSRGIHQLRLVEYSPTGEIIEHGLWTFEVRRSRAFRDAEGEFGLGLSLDRRLANERPSPPPTSQFQGAFRGEGRLQDGSWEAQGGADLLYLPEEAQRLPNQEPLTLGDYQVSWQDGHWRASAGLQSPLPEGLLAQDFIRRGVNLGLNLPRARLQLFALRTREAVGWDNVLGISDGDDRLHGASLSTRPLSRPEALILDAAWLQGRSPGQSGAATLGDPTTLDNTAGLVRIESLWHQRRLRLRAEWAWSRWRLRENGEVAGEDLRGDGRRLLIGYTLPSEVLPSRITLERSRIGTYYRSLANPDAPNDRRGDRISLESRWRSLDLRAWWGKEQDNVDDLAFLPRIETRAGEIALAFTPYGIGERHPWLGDPNLGLRYDDNRQRVVRAGAGLETGDLRATRNWGLTGEFNYPWGTLSTTLNQGRDRDLRNRETSRSLSSELGASTRVSEALQLGLTLQRERYHSDSAPAEASTSRTWNLDLDYTPRSDVSLTAALSLARDRSDDATRNIEQRRLLLSLAWEQSPPAALRPGVLWRLEGNHDEWRDNGNVESDYQIFLRLELTWNNR